MLRQSHILIAAAIVTLAVACGGSQPAPTPTEAPSPTETASPTAAPRATATPRPTSAPATATPRPSPTPAPEPPAGLTRGGVLRFAVPEAPPHHDVHQSVSSALLTWGPGLAYSRLFRYQAPAGASLPSRLIECDLCTSWEHVSPLSFDIRLREDARWQDLPPVNGRRVTAQDVVFSYERQQTVGWPNAAVLRNIATIVAIDDLTLRITVISPDAELLENLADGSAKIVAPEAVGQRGDLLRGPTVGSGPWVLEEITSAAATYQANPSYYESGLPYLDGLSVQVIPDASTRATGLRAGLLDFDQPSYDEFVSATERFPDIQGIGVPDSSAGVEVAINTSRPPLDSLTVRQALLQAWDLEAMADAIWAGAAPPGAGLPLPLQSWLLEYDSEFASLFGNPAQAGRLLADTGVRFSAPITVRVGEFGDPYVAQAQAMVDALNEIGVPAQIERVTTRSFADDVWIGGDFDIFVGAPLPVASLSGLLFAVHHSSGPWNATRYSTPELDDLIERQAATLDFDLRKQLVADIQREILSGAHRFNAATQVNYWMWRPSVRDFVPNVTRGENHFLARTWLDRANE